MAIDHLLEDFTLTLCNQLLFINFKKARTFWIVFFSLTQLLPEWISFILTQITETLKSFRSLQMVFILDADFRVFMHRCVEFICLFIFTNVCCLGCALMPK